MKAITKVEVALIAEKLKFVATLDRFYNHIKQTQLSNSYEMWIQFEFHLTILLILKAFH